MKIIGLLIGVFFIMTFNTIQSQEEIRCKVLYEDIKGIYTGECKKGFAHGNGIFEFSDGIKIYKGQFRKGKFNGKGTLMALNEGEEEILSKGLWKNNVYIGEKKIPSYKIKRNINLDRYTVRKKGDGNKIEINFYQNGGRNNVGNLTTFANSGVRISGGYIYGYENVEYPFSCEIVYTTLSKLKTTAYQVRFELIINEPGDWEISLYN